MAKKVHCACCGRQIVSYKSNDKYTIGPASDGCLSLGFGKYACPPCSVTEAEFDRINNEVEENTIYEYTK